MTSGRFAGWKLELLNPLFDRIGKMYKILLMSTKRLGSVFKHSHFALNKEHLYLRYKI